MREWKSMDVPEVQQDGLTWERQISEVWQCNEEHRKLTCQIRDFKTPLGRPMRHLIVKDVNKDKYFDNPIIATLFAEDPSYYDRVSIIRELGKWKKLAVEVFPREKDLVDRANLYHLWEIEDRNQLPFDIDLIKDFHDLKPSRYFSPFIGFDKAFDVNYSVALHTFKAGQFAYLFVTPIDGVELKWKQKYEIKNGIFGKNVMAVEVISEELGSLPYTCLVCYPWNYEIDFSL